MAADALSRIEARPQLFAQSIPEAIQLEEIVTKLDKDSELRQIKEDILKDLNTHVEFLVIKGRLLRQGKLIIPQSSHLVALILKEYHDGKVGGQGGILKTQKTIDAMFYWKGMMSDIRSYVASCLVCKRHKYSTLAPAALLQPLPIPHNIWEDISMDFVEGLLKSKGINVLMVVVDRLSKYAQFIGLKYPFDVPTVAMVFMKEVVRLHGFPKTIVLDRDRLFIGRFWTELFRLAGTSLCFNTSYHPQSKG